MLPTINSIAPTSMPAQAAIDFPNAFLTSLRFFAGSVADKWTLSIATRNYNAAAAQLAADTPENNQYLTIGDVAAYAANYPLVARTLAAVLITAGLCQAEQAAQRSLAVANAMDDSDPAKVAAVASATASVAAAAASLA